MTAYTKDILYGWTSDTTNGGFCTNIGDGNSKSFYLEFSGVKPVSSSNSSPIPLSLSGVGIHWAITLFGHDPTDAAGRKASSNGLVLTPNNKKCSDADQSPAILSVGLKPIANPQSTFYPDRAQAYEDDPRVTAKRFFDITPVNATTTADPTNPATLLCSAKYDQDVCERLEKVTFVPDTLALAPVTYTYRCLRGTCEIGIDVQ
jgi:hypothetical protein